RSSLSTFFLASIAAPSDLPSFPTRRSSDLGPVVGARPPSAGRRQLPGVLPRRPHPRRGRPAELVRGTLRRGGRRAEAAESAALPDRKSTRLNSSHRTISYAVFCLKKKKRTH